MSGKLGDTSLENSSPFKEGIEEAIKSHMQTSIEINRF